MSEGFIDELRNTLDKGAVLSGGDIDARYHHDLAGNPAPKPRAVIRQNDGKCLRVAAVLHREGIPVTTQGGMTGLVRGALPNANEIVLSMERMNSVEEVEPPQASPSRRPARRCKRSRSGSSRMA